MIEKNTKFVKSVTFTYKERQTVRRVKEKMTLKEMVSESGIEMSCLSRAIREWRCNSTTKEVLMDFINKKDLAINQLNEQKTVKL
jgi:hypothetical protein